MNLLRSQLRQTRHGSHGTQRIVLAIGDGNFTQGFPVTVEISEAGRAPHQILQGKLPPAPSIPTLYEQWQLLYRNLPNSGLRIIVPQAQVTNQSAIEDCRKAAEALENAMLRWLGYAPVLRLQMQFQQAIAPHQSAQLILQTHNPLLKRLPWHLWEMFDQYPHLGLALHSSHPPALSEMRSPVDILAVLGNSEALDVERDRQILEQLPQANVTLLDKPSRQLLNEKLWERPWDILFFAGHSSSQPDAQHGTVQINERESLSLSELEYALQHALRKGLKLAIFNSCDGLGLAQNLAELKIPYTVVMREPVADPVAQTFLRYFLEHFSQGQPLHLALRMAREKLQGLEANFPCASWLPVICHHPSAPVLYWPRALMPPTWIKPLAGVGLGAATLGLIIAGLNHWPPRPQPSDQLSPPEALSSTAAIAPALPPAPASLAASEPESSSNLAEGNLGDRFSLGNRILITNTGHPQTKQKAAAAFARGNYAEAIAAFEASLDYAPNDPETLIYLNNAKAAIAAQGKHSSVLRIATSVPIGDNLNIAQEMLRGIAQAQDAYNQKAATLDQPLLQVQIANDDNSIDLGRQIAERHVQDPAILAVIGHNASEVSLAAGEIYQREKLVMVTPTSGALELSDLGDYIFRTVPSVRADAQQLARHAIQKSGQRRFALCGDSRSPYSLTFNEEFRQAVRGNSGQVSPIPCDFSSEAFNSGKFISQAIADEVDAILLNPSVQRISQATQLAKASANRMALLSGSTMATVETLEKGQEAVNGMVLSVAWHPQKAQDPNFLQQAQDTWNSREVNWRTALSYDAVQTVLTGIEKPSSGQSARQSLQQALSATSFVAQGATGAIRFQQSGDRRPSKDIGLLIQVQSAPGSSQGYRFVALDN